MTTPIWPNTLPMVWSNSGTISKQTLVTEGDSGSSVPTSLRRWTRVPGAKAQISWTFLEGEYKIFVNFWQNTLLNGHRWFYIILPTALGMQYCIVRATDKVYEAKMSGYRKWDVSMEIDIRERPIGGSDLGPPAPTIVPTDPYWGQVVLLVQGNTPAVGVMQDDSSFAHDSASWQSFGVWAQPTLLSGVYARSPSSCIQFNGNNVTFQSTDFDLGQVFTVEAFVAISAAQIGASDKQSFYNCHSAASGKQEINLAIYADGSVQFYASHESGNNPITINSPPGTFPFDGNFYHIALCWAHSTAGFHQYLFFNGILQGECLPTNLNNNGWSMQPFINIGANIPARGGTVTSDTQPFFGRLDDYRVTKGVARYTSSFTVPVLPFPTSGP